MSDGPLAIARACLRAYVEKDRDATEALIANDFHFTSPIDNRLDRSTYFEVCWPNSAQLVRFDHIYGWEDADRAFLVCEAATSKGRRFRNAEVHTVRNGRLIETEVYFGWDLPHPVPSGLHRENEGQGHA